MEQAYARGLKGDLCGGHGVAGSTDTTSFTDRDHSR